MRRESAPLADPGMSADRRFQCWGHTSLFGQQSLGLCVSRDHHAIEVTGDAAAPRFGRTAPNSPPGGAAVPPLAAPRTPPFSRASRALPMLSKCGGAALPSSPQALQCQIRFRWAPLHGLGRAQPTASVRVRLLRIRRPRRSSSDHRCNLERAFGRGGG